MSKQTLHSNERGVASIIVATILMIVMTLIVLAMSQNTNREQRQTLDRQLSDQAFYNAESGINDLASYLYKTPGANIDKKTCDPLGAGAPTRDIDGTDGVNKYSCLMYDKAPKTIQYDNVSVSSPRVVPIQPVNDTGNAVPVAKLTVSWDDAANRESAISGSCNFNSGSPALPDQCSYGGLRFELIAPASNRETINERGLVAYLLPNATNGGDLSVLGSSVPDNKGIIDATKCNGGAGTRRCSKTITNVNSSNLYLNLRSLYRPVNLTISAVDSNGAAVRFKDSQIMIDSTGRANDVLRRVQVRIPAKSQYSYPGFAIQTKDSICKIMNVSKNAGGSVDVSSANPTDCPIN